MNFTFSGTIIARQWMVTAAHCFDNGRFKVFAILNENDLDSKDSAEYTVESQNIRIHPKYRAVPGMVQNYKSRRENFPGSHKFFNYHNDIIITKTKTKVEKFFMTSRWSKCRCLTKFLKPVVRGQPVYPP